MNKTDTEASQTLLYFLFCDLLSVILTPRDRRDTEEFTVEAVSSLKLLVDLMAQHPANNSCMINTTDQLWPFNQRVPEF